jgi:hypothetical protein
MVHYDSDNLRRDAKTARSEAEKYQSRDLLYSELMFTYEQLGELLNSDRNDAEYEEDCHHLVEKLIAIGRAQTREMEQTLAMLFARHMAGD